MEPMKTFSCQLEAFPDESPEFCMDDVCCGIYKRQFFLLPLIVWVFFLVGIVSPAVYYVFLNNWSGPSRNDENKDTNHSQEELQPMVCIAGKSRSSNRRKSSTKTEDNTKKVVQTGNVSKIKDGKTNVSSQTVKPLNDSAYDKPNNKHELKHILNDPSEKDVLTNDQENDATDDQFTAKINQNHLPESNDVKINDKSVPQRNDIKIEADDTVLNDKSLLQSNDVQIEADSTALNVTRNYSSDPSQTDDLSKRKFEHKYDDISVAKVNSNNPSHTNILLGDSKIDTLENKKIVKQGFSEESIDSSTDDLLAIKRIRKLTSPAGKNSDVENLQAEGSKTQKRPTGHESKDSSKATSSYALNVTRKQKNVSKSLSKSNDSTLVKKNGKLSKKSTT